MSLVFIPLTGNPEAHDYMDYYNWLQEQKEKSSEQEDDGHE